MNARSLPAVAVLTSMLGGLAVSGCARGSSGTSADQLGDVGNRVVCGPTVCPQGEVCCNASCGICTPPDGACVQVACDPPSAGPCRSDSDCRTFADYCTGCDCRALSICEKDPVCPGPPTMCFINPCWNKEAFCDAGRCALRDQRATCPVEKCGPQLGMPNSLCPDGNTVTGPSGRCLANADGTCGWEIVSSCPDPAVCTRSP